MERTHLTRFLFLFFFLSLTGITNAIIHHSCTGNVSKPDATCCPIPPGHKAACGFPSRGICRPVQVYREPVQKNYAYWFLHDFRMSWPSRVFKYACECVAQYSGQDCSECWFGYAGSKCQYRTRFVRKNALKMTKTEKTNFWKVLVASKRNKSPLLVPTVSTTKWSMGAPWRNVSHHEEMMFRNWFARFSIVTNNAAKCKKYSGKNGINFANGQPINPLFHRMFLLYWEERLRKVALEKLNIANFTFPYWDWTDAKKCDICTNDLVGKETQYLNLESGAYFLHYDNPYASWGAHCSMRYRTPCANCGKELKLDILTRRWINNKFPTTKDIRRVLGVPLFYSENKCQGLSYWLTSGKGCLCNKTRETMSGQIKGMVRGTFHDSNIAPNDPFYIFHYANIDRLMSRWYYRMLPSNHELPAFWGSKPGACRQCTFVSYMPTVTLEDMLVDSRALGYKYDNLDFGNLKESEVVAHIGQKFISPNTRCSGKGSSTTKKSEDADDSKSKKLLELIEKIDELSSGATINDEGEDKK